MSVLKDEAELVRWLGADHAALAAVITLYARDHAAAIHGVCEYRGTLVDGSEAECLRCITVIGPEGRILRLERRLAAGGWAGEWEVT